MTNLIHAIWQGMQPAIGFFKHIGTYVDDICFAEPLRALYFDGPDLYGHGFWGGRNPEDICAQLSSVPADTWKNRMSDECQSMLERKFRSFLICARFAVMICAIIKIWNFITLYYTMIRPMNLNRRQQLDDMVRLLREERGLNDVDRRDHYHRLRNRAPSGDSLSSLDSPKEKE